jgi:predicted phosphodiesterase
MVGGKMKIRVISDLHVDINSDFDISWKNKDVLTIIAGDIAGSLNDTKKFLREKFNNVIFIAGNHIVYNYDKKPIMELYQELRDEFPINSNIAFLENDYKIIDDIVFIGTTLWTDYTYNDGLETSYQIAKMNMEIVKKYMNDYRWGLYRNNNNAIIKLNPIHCAKMFQKALEFIKATYDKFADSAKKMILIVHHGISPQILQKEYANDEINSAYITDLENYIQKELPKLSLIIHGHIHVSQKYKIGNISVICNSRGYVDDYPSINKNFDKDLTVDI